jgi:cytochrome P450
MAIAVGRDLTDLASPELTADPYPYFRSLRETDPVHWNARHGAWLVTTYRDVVAGFRDKRLSSNRLQEYRRRRLTDHERATLGESFAVLESWMVFQDEPDHKRLRGIVSKAFTPRRLALMEQDVHEVVSGAVDALRRRMKGSPGEPVDLLNDFAYEIPATVICRMLNVPEEHQDRFIAWSDDLVAVISGDVGVADRNERAHRAVVALEEYLTERIDASRHLEDGGLLADIVAAEADGDRLSRTEVIATAILLLFAGHRTTACLIANGFNALMRHPDQYGLLRSDPSLVNNAVDEILRWEGHTKLSVRIVAEDFEWDDQNLRTGERVFLVQLSANRDEAEFADADRFDLRRENTMRHVGFGNGIHHCLGAALARMEARATFTNMLGQLPVMEPVESRPRWVPTLISRTQSALPVRIRSGA